MNKAWGQEKTLRVQVQRPGLQPQRYFYTIPLGRVSFKELASKWAGCKDRGDNEVLASLGRRHFSAVSGKTQPKSATVWT